MNKENKNQGTIDSSPFSQSSFGLYLSGLRKGYLLCLLGPVEGFGQLRDTKLFLRPCSFSSSRTSPGQLTAEIRSTEAHSTGWQAQALVTLVALIDLARTWPPHCKPQSCGLFIPFHYLPPHWWSLALVQALVF